jgi:hypothetical protein
MTRTLIALALALAFSPVAPAATLLPPGADDLVAARVVSLPAPAGAIERKPVSFAYVLDPGAALAPDAPFVGESREWYAQVDAATLRRGVALDASAPGAVVRLSPLGAAAAVAPDALELRRDGKAVASAFAHRSDADQLRAAGFDAGRGAAVVQLAPELGAGRFEVRLAQAQGRYLMHVYEPRSETVLRSGTTRASAHAGSPVEVRARLDGAAGAQFGGQLVAPSGRTVDLAFVAAGDGTARAKAVLPADAAGEPGLWEAQVFAEGRDGTRRRQRDGRTAFAVVQPTARFAGPVEVGRRGARFVLPLEVGSAGRYEVAGTLYATGRDGLAVPVAQAASAAWLEPGQRRLAITFGAHLVPMGYGAPYELRGLTLKDQSRMGLLETRALAVAMREPAGGEATGKR